MYARVITMRVQPDSTAQATEACALDSVTTQLPGFNGALLLTDPETGKTMSITLWRSEADERVSEARGYVQHQLAALGAVLAEPPRREQFAVSSQA